MNRIRKLYLPNLCMSFTLVMIISATLKLISNNDPTGYHSFILQLAGSIGFIGFVDYFLDKLEFKRWAFQIVLQAVVNYIILLSLGYYFHWIGLRISSTIYFTVLFIIVFAIIYTHTYQMMKQEDRRINDLLSQRNVQE